MNTPLFRKIIPLFSAIWLASLCGCGPGKLEFDPNRIRREAQIFCDAMNAGDMSTLANMFPQKMLKMSNGRADEYMVSVRPSTR